jgi:hypothetical protein
MIDGVNKLLQAGAFSIALTAVSSVTAGAQEVWLGGVDPVVLKAQKHIDTPRDFMNLFQPDAPWKTAASGLKAFKISMQFGLRAPDDQLDALIGDLKRRHIALAFEAGLLDGDERCGKGVEGYAAPKGVEALAKRVSSHGGTIDYIAMDEPVWFGHALSGGAHCHDPIPAVVAQVAERVEILRRYFPNIQIGDTEPINSSPYAMSQDPRFVDDVMAFADQLQQKTGVKLAFIHADIAWKWNWRPTLEAMSEQARARGIRFGVICDGDEDVGGDEAWVRQALERCQAVAADPKAAPNQWIVQSWETLPTKMLPETDPGSLTFEVKQIEASFKGAASRRRAD